MFCAFGVSISVSDRLSRIFKRQFGSRKNRHCKTYVRYLMVSKRDLRFQAIFRFHLKLQGCTNHHFLGSMLLFSVVEKATKLPASSMLPSMAACFLHRMWYHPFPQGVGKPPTARKLTMSPKTKPWMPSQVFGKFNARRYFLMYLSLNTGQFLMNIRPEGVEDANEYHHITINNKVHGHIWDPFPCWHPLTRPVHMWRLWSLCNSGLRNGELPLRWLSCNSFNSVLGDVAELIFAGNLFESLLLLKHVIDH